MKRREADGWRDGGQRRHQEGPGPGPGSGLQLEVEELHNHLLQGHEQKRAFSRRDPQVAHAFSLFGALSLRNLPAAVGWSTQTLGCSLQAGAGARGVVAVAGMPALCPLWWGNL